MTERSEFENFFRIFKSTRGQKVKFYVHHIWNNFGDLNNLTGFRAIFYQGTFSPFFRIFFRWKLCLDQTYQEGCFWLILIKRFHSLNLLVSFSRFDNFNQQSLIYSGLIYSVINFVNPSNKREFIPNLGSPKKHQIHFYLELFVELLTIS